MDKLQDLRAATAIIRKAINSTGAYALSQSYGSKPHLARSILKSASKHLLERMVGILKETMEQVQEETDAYLKLVCED
jgi:leucyl aminopeptidase (aminopeptidase T)